MRRLHLLLLSVLAASVLTPRPGLAQSRSAPLPALQTVSRCVRDTGTLHALLLIDESGSLRTTDPKNERVTAARTAVEALAGLAEHEIGGKNPRVDIHIATFGVDFETLVPWTPLTYESASTISAQIDALATKNKAVDTDYAAALIGAERTLQATEPGACQVLLWFTDGKYDIQTGARRAQPTKAYAPEVRLDKPDGPKRLLEFGQQLLCKDGGLADQLRAENVATVSLALTTDFEPTEQIFLRSLTLGRDPSGQSCGSRNANTLGAYVPLNDLSELVAALDGVASILGYGTPGKSETDIAICAATPCSEGTRSLPVELGASRVRVTVQTGRPGVDVVLEAPSDSATFTSTTKQSTVRLGDVPVRAVWLGPDVVSFDAKLPAETTAWAGSWKLTLVDRAGDRSGGSDRPAKGFRPYYFGGAVLRPVAAGRWEVATSRTGPRLVQAVLDAVRIDVDASIVGETERSKATVRVQSDGTADVSANGASVSATPARLESSVAVTTKSGIRLASTTETDPYELAAAPTAPRTTPAPAPSPKPSPKPSRVPLYAAGAVAALALLALAALVRRRRTSTTFSDLDQLLFLTGRVRVAQDRIAQSRVTWLSDVGSESQFRLSRAPFKAGPTGRRPSFTTDPFKITRHSKTHARVEGPGSMHATGRPGIGKQLGDDHVLVPSELSPVWVFSGTLIAATGVRPSMAPNRPSRDREVTNPEDPDATFIAPRPGKAPSPSAGPAERAFEGDLLLIAASDADIALLERDITEALATSLFSSRTAS